MTDRLDLLQFRTDEVVLFAMHLVHQLTEHRQDLLVLGKHVLLQLRKLAGQCVDHRSDVAVMTGTGAFFGMCRNLVGMVLSTLRIGILGWQIVRGRFLRSPLDDPTGRAGAGPTRSD